MPKRRTESSSVVPQVKGRNFSLVEMDTELWSEDTTPSASRHGSQDGELTEITKESWEVGWRPFRFDLIFFFSGPPRSSKIDWLHDLWLASVNLNFVVWVQLIKAPYVKIYSIIKTQTMSADGSDEVTDTCTITCHTVSTLRLTPANRTHRNHPRPKERWDAFGSSAV